MRPKPVAAAAAMSAPPGNQKEANRGRRRGMQADPDRRFTQLDSMSAYGQRRKRDGSITL